MEQVNERSTAYLTVTFKDKDRAAQQPTAASYRIDDVATGTEIRDTDLDAGHERRDYADAGRQRRRVAAVGG